MEITLLSNVVDFGGNVYQREQYSNREPEEKVNDEKLAFQISNNK